MKGWSVQIIYFFVCLLAAERGYAQTVDDLILFHEKNFVICNDAGTAFKTNVTNRTVHFGFKVDGFKIKLGDAKHTEYDGPQPGSQKTITYEESGYYQLIFSGVTTGGDTLKRIYQVVAAGLPKVAIEKQDESVKCLGTEVIYKVNVYEKNSSGTNYTLHYDDGTTPDVVTNEALRRAQGQFKHKFTRSYCEIPDRPNPNDHFFNIKLTAKNECYEDATRVNEFVAVPFDANYTFSHIGQNKVCTYENVSLRNISEGGMLSDCTYGDKFAFWDFGNGKTSEDWEPYILYEEAKNYKIKLTVSNIYPCAMDTTSKVIELINRVVADFQIARDTVCGNEEVKFTDRSSGDDIRIRRWSVLPLDGTTIPVFNENEWSPKIVFGHWGRYRVKLFIQNECSSDEADTIIVVKQNPDIVRFDLPKAMCPPRLDLSRYVSVLWNGNQEKPKWTIRREGAAVNTGFTCAEGSSLQSIYPVIDFEISGKYSIRLELPDAGCGGTLLDTTAQVIVYDPYIHKEVIATQLNICEGGAVSFTNRSTGEDLQYEWSVRPTANVLFSGGTRNDQAEPVLQFNKYGDYEVRLNLSTASGCGMDDTTFRVHIRKDPSIFFFEPPEAVCPGEPYALDFKGLVDYQFYNNDKKVKWTITPMEGMEWKKETGVDSLYPVVQFSTPGSHLFTVKLESVGCPEIGRELEMTRSIRVRNSTMTMTGLADDTLVCEGQNLLFSLRAEEGDGEPLVYAWKISPPDGSYEFKDFGNNKKISKIHFNHWGSYEVKGMASGFCGDLDTTFRITVQKDPEVRLKDTIGFCPGGIDMVKYTEYQWYNNKKEVTWKITPIDLNTPADGFELSDKEAEYPTIHFKSKGEYKVQAELTSHTLGCSEKFLKDITSYVVYDTTIEVKVTVDRTDICEGDQVFFTNVSTGVGVTFDWRVIGSADGWKYVNETNANSQSPILLFTKNGEYEVMVSIVGTCNQKQKSFHITVRGIPEIDFTEKMEKICAGGELVDMAVYVNYKDRKNSTIVPHWTIEPKDGVSFEPGYGADSDLPRIHFTENNHYRVIFVPESQCVTLPQVYTAEIDVIKQVAKPSFQMPQEACIPMEVSIVNDSPGDSLTYTWTVSPSTGWQYAEGDSLHSAQPHFIFKEQGSYEVALGIQNICYGQPLMLKDTIRTYAVPKVTCGDIDRVCENYLLKTIDTVKVDDCNDSLRRSLWTIDPPLAGFVNTDSFPELSFPHGEYRVKAEFWNGCATPGVAEFRVSVDEFIPIPPIANDTLCHLTSALALEALPAGGEWTLAGAEDLLRVENGVTWFDPKRSGEYEMVYSFSNGSCTATNIKKIKVHSLPKVDAGNDLTMCMNHSPKELVGQPDGGWWEGTGVVTPVFTAQAPGAVPMVYHYKDEHRCINQDTAMMTVYSLPDTAFVSRKQYCRGIESEFIPRSPEKQYIWNYGDLTPLDTVVEQGKHIYESGGFFDVVLVAVSEHGCLDTSAVRKVEVVNDAPPAVFSMSEHVACGPEVEINIGVDAMNYADPNLHFEWDFGNGHRSENLLPENPQKYSGDLWDTTYYIKWRVFNICNETNMQDSVLVGSVPQIGFTFQHKWDCSPLKLRVKNTSTGNGNHYTWYMGDHTAPERGYEPIEHLYQAEKGTAVFQVSLVAENNCGRDSMAKPLTVLAQSVEAFFETPKNHICVGEEICFTNQTTDTARYVSYKFWDFGDEVRDTTWNACHTYRDSGSYSVLLYVDNGCSFDTITDRIQVLPLPQLSIESESVLCDQDTFHFNIRSDQKLQRWRWNFGDGRDTLVRHPKYIFSHSGIYLVTLEVIAENIAHCRASSRKEVTVNPRPDLFFTPFDTLVCSPWLYLPKVTGEAAVLMWDYGDGSKQTSAMEHWYENDTDALLHRRVVLHALSDKACAKDFIGEITVSNLPVSEMRKEVTSGRPQKVDLINLSKDYSECIWYLPPDRVEHTFDDRHLEFMENGTQVFSLVALNQYGCKDSVSLEHRVMIKGLYFPNTFIPHSRNGKINCFNGIGMGLAKYKLEIFDPYGNKLWETQALQDGKPSEGWNGCNVDGKAMTQGLYIWRAEAIFADDEVWTGKNNASGVVETTQGTVLLMRE